MSHRGRQHGSYTRGRGRSRGRGGRGSHSFAGSSNDRGGGEDRPRPPPHLKGREIGLWYASRQKAKDLVNLPKVTLNSGKQAKIVGLLQQLEARGTASTSSAADSDFMRRYRQNLFENAVADDRLQASGKAAAVEILQRIPPRDLALQKELEMKQHQSKKYMEMMKFREKLPAFQHKDEFLKLISEHQVIVISGETGCGKTTQCCQLILDQMIQSGNGSLCNIICTQPRRISAVSVAERVADERDEKIGTKSVGYSIRLETRLPTYDRGSLLYCTTGVVFQYLKQDPLLSKYSHIVVDEIHERDVLSDFLIAILKDLVKFRSDLKVILMSATLNAEHFSRYFGNCPCFNIPGFTFPVEEFYLEDVLEKTRFTFEARVDNSQQRNRGEWKNRYGQHNDEETEFKRMLEVHIRKLDREKSYSRHVLNELAKEESEEFNLDLIEALLQYICDTDKTNGAVLIFVPGWDQISKLHTQLQVSFPSSKNLLIPLHSLMPTVNQREVFNRPTGGRRKIILSTNIAETSITIDDIVYVIDAGRIKITNYDLKRNLETLDTEWVSLANSTQRKGRAGRVQEGVCYHLFSKARLLTLERFKKPEILRKRLEEVVLQIKMLKLGDAGRLFRRLLDTPDEKAVDFSLKRLIQLHALDEDENLTPLGFHLAHLPMDPQTGKMILMAGIFGCLDPILTIAASLSFKDGFYIPLGQERNVDRVRRELSQGTKSDHMVTVYAMDGFERASQANRERDYCYRNFLSASTMNMLINMKGQLARHLYDMKFITETDFKESTFNKNSENVGLITAIICAGLYPNIANVRINRNKDRTSTYVTARTHEDGRINLHPKSVNANERDFESPFLAYFQKMKSKSVYLYDTTMVSPFPIIFFGGRLRFLKKKGLGVVSVDENVELLIEQPIYELIQALRKHLDKLLEEKIINPGPTCWSELSKEGALLRAIIELITAEYHELLGEATVEDSDSDYD